MYALLSLPLQRAYGSVVRRSWAGVHGSHGLISVRRFSDAVATVRAGHHMPRTVATVQHRRWGRLPMNTSTTCYFDNWEDPSHPSPSLESYARGQPSFNLILVEQLPQPFLNAWRSVFAQEFEHQAVERLHANLKRLVAHPQHVALNALHVVHYASPKKPSHATMKPVWGFVRSGGGRGRHRPGTICLWKGRPRSLSSLTGFS